MGPSPNFHSLQFIPIYDDLPNMSQTGVCEKFLIKGLPPREHFRNFDFLLRITRNKLHQILSTNFKFRQKYRLVQKLWPFEFFLTSFMFPKKILQKELAGSPSGTFFEILIFY
jgi:hypothetical protein